MSTPFRVRACDAASVAGDLYPPIARRVDRCLCSIDEKLDWLKLLSPLDTHGLWEAFESAGYRVEPELAYPAFDMDLRRLRRALLELPVEDVEIPELQALLWEKQRELDRLIELLELRGTAGFLPAAVDLWGDAEPDLRALAEEILRTVRDDAAPAETAGCEAICEEARRQLERYREREPHFECRIEVVEDLTARLMVAKDTLLVERDIRVPVHQVAPLVHHEIGTHVLTRYNGALQGLRQLQCGLAHYQNLQEGLAVLAEYLSGYLSPARLRILAARVVATAAVCAGRGVVDLSAELRDRYGFAPADAFNIALRVARGGGMTKDAAYLRGVRDLLGYLRDGGSLEFLFIGKLGLPQVPTLRVLARLGLIRPPALLPLFLQSPAGRARLERCRGATVLDLLDAREAA